MLQNYHYFLVLAEEGNISRAAARLYVSHQCLSKYLKSLEEHYGVSLFNRKPKLSLTPAGQIYYESLRQLELLENNLESQLSDCHDSNTGTIRIGTTEGRFRILIPDLLVNFQREYPNVELVTECANSNELREMVLNNQLDMMVTAFPADGSNRLSSTLLINEQLYLIISDNLLQKYFPDSFPECRQRFQKGVDLKDFQHVPFILNRKGFSSRDMVDSYTQRNGITLNCIREIVQADIHYLLSAKDYAASFCFSMFLPGVSDANRLSETNSRLNIFPLTGFDSTNPVRLLYLKNRIFPAYGYYLISLMKEICQPFKNPPLEIG